MVDRDNEIEKTSINSKNFKNACDYNLGYYTLKIVSAHSKMKLNLKKSLTDAEWDEIVKEGLGVRHYQGKKTLFWNGENLRDESGEYLIYNFTERETWEVIIVLPGVEMIPRDTFRWCMNVKVVIMADTVKEIEEWAFFQCYSLEFVRLSRNLEGIASSVFSECRSLTSVFIPSSCRLIEHFAFKGCKKLIILNVPQHCQLGEQVISDTALIAVSSFETTSAGGLYYSNDEVNTWIKNINQSEECALHRACSSFNPITEIIFEISKRDGLQSFQKENEIGITPVKYLEENPFADVDQVAIVKKYILEMMGEIM